MKQYYLLKKIFLIIIILSLPLFGIQTIPLLDVSAQENTWSVTLHITETSGIGTTIVLGGSSNASDFQDNFDRPEPPAPPELSYVEAWFTTSLPIPFNRLLQEFKHIPSKQMEWNFSLLWVSDQENNSFTTINISWDPTQVIQSNYNSFQLYQNNTPVADMLTDNFYLFPSNGTIHHFQIISQSIQNNNTIRGNDILILPMTLGIIVLVIIITSALLLYKRKK